MNESVSKSLDLVTSELETSSTFFLNLSKYVSTLDRDLYLLESTFDDSTYTLCRIILDNWNCEIEFQQEKNAQFKSSIKKLQAMLTEDINQNNLVASFSQICDLNASVLDNKGRDESGRPVPGLLCRPVSQKLANMLIENELDFEAIQSWDGWVRKFEAHISIMDEIVKHFPASHNFGSIPWSISTMLRTLLKLIIEQVNISKTLQILTEDDPRGEIFHLDVLLLKQRIHAIPFGSDGDE